MTVVTKSGRESPRVIIYSESGPLAGDLGACLAGRFAVERVTSLQGAHIALETPTAALMVVPGRRDRMGSECLPLVRRALDRGCRVLLLGNASFPLDDDRKGMIVELPQFPSPEALFAGLRGLTAAGSAPPGRQAGRALEAEGS